MKKHILGLNVALVTVALMVTACDGLISQNPADTFWDKKFPKQLEWIRSQMREISVDTENKIVARVKNDQQRTDLLKVAVIDAGVDIAHPDLINQIDYRIDNNRIVGAGYDIMGGGNFGSQVLVNPTLFAFGAGSLREGKIVNPPASPLKEIEQLNNRFRDLIMEGIHSDPILQESLFARLTRDSFTVFGFEDIKNETEDQLSSYKENQEKGRLISVNTPVTGNDQDRIRMAQNNWTYLTDDQKPDSLDIVTSIEHGDKFISLVKKSYETLDSEMGFSKKITLFNQFKNIQDDENPNNEAEKFPKDLIKAMDFIIFGADAYDPIRRLERIFRESPEYHELNFADAFRKYYATRVEQLDTILKNSKNIKKSDLKILKQNKAQMAIFKNLVENLIQLQQDPVAYKKMHSEIRRFVYRTQHPYISAESNDNEHATHVSGVIAKQHPNIRIVPIRVTTQSVILGKDHTKEITEKLVTEFKAFTQSAYFAPLKTQIASEYGNIKMSDNALINGVKAYLSKQSMNAVFIVDVLKAVEAAGRDQVKLANVSLGTTFKKNYSLDKKAESMTEDIFSEFARYQIGRTIQEKAPGTLFMIATGNDGGWIDGISKSAFPVGITSTRLIKISKDLGLEQSPNNRSKNVLAVASINKNGTLTEFSNILLDPNIPEIFSTGEEIMSSVPGKSLGASMSLANKITKKLPELLSTMTTENIDLLENLPRDQQGGLRQKLRTDLRFSRDLVESLGILLHVQQHIDRANMSGTSMATPTVTGIVARYIAERMITEKVSAAEIYNHPNYTPEKIVGDIMKMSRTNQINSAVSVQMLVDNIKAWSKSKGVSIQTKEMNRLVSPRCQAVFAM
jgi:subtilisin family serine protease